MTCGKHHTYARPEGRSKRKITINKTNDNNCVEDGANRNSSIQLTVGRFKVTVALEGVKLLPWGAKLLRVGESTAMTV
jgi:hypothetical protein